MRCEKTPLHNLVISFLNTESETDCKQWQYQRVLNDVITCKSVHVAVGGNSPRRPKAANQTRCYASMFPSGTSPRLRFHSTAACKSSLTLKKKRFPQSVFDVPIPFSSLSLTRFVRQVLPYWGNPHDRKVIRKFWSQVRKR